MENVYCIYEDEKILFICHDKKEAQEMVLALTEEYIYHAYLREADKCGNDLALWVFQNAYRYGWDKYQIKEFKF